MVLLSSFDKYFDLKIFIINENYRFNLNVTKKDDLRTCRYRPVQGLTAVLEHLLG